MFSRIKEIDAAELNRWLEEEGGQFRIIDVREMPEIAGGTIADAVPIPLATLPVRLNELDRDEKLVFICRSGARSAQACHFLKQYGFDDIYNLRGGIIAWAHQSLPIALPG